MTWFVIFSKMQNDCCFFHIRMIPCCIAFLQAVFAENPFRSLIGRHLGFLRRALPGTSRRAQKKQKLFVNYRSPRSSASRNNSKMAATKRTPGFQRLQRLQRLQLQRLRVGYLLQKLYVDTNFCTVSCFPICQKIYYRKKIMYGISP